MNFQEYKLTRENILAKYSPLRLDCMNPFKAMDYLKDSKEASTARSVQETFELLLSSIHAEEYRNLAIPTRGVRSSLDSLFEIIAQRKSDLWLPKDVYPFYWECTKSHKISPYSFPTLPSPNFSFLKETSLDCFVLLTNPISPLGRALSENDYHQITAWLEQSKNRKIILDTVYSYGLHIDPISKKLYETGQCFITHSLSKAWLQRGIFGVLFTPEPEYEVCLNMITSPNQLACDTAYEALSKSLKLPHLQQQAFDKEWQKLNSDIQNFDSTFTPPSMGYFSCIKANFMDVLTAHNTLLVPASVFGSRDHNLSIATCLFNISNP